MAAPTESGSGSSSTTGSNSDTSTSKQLNSAPLPGGDSGEVTGVATGSSGTGTGSAPTTTNAPLSKEQAVAAKLGAPNRFLVGLGNDPSGNGSTHRMAYEMGKPVDIHYMYLSNLDWPTWNSPTGAYVGLEAAAAKANGAIPMFTLYQMATNGDGNLAPAATDAFMTKYWANVRVLFAQLAAFGDANILQVEPDFWGYAEKNSDDPSKTTIKVNNLVSECSDLPNDVSGFGKCIIRLSRALSPKTVIGLHGSPWGSTVGGVSQPDKVSAFMKSVGADQADILVIETLDRDAGCFEAAVDPNCQRAGDFYWDETNTTHPNFNDHLAWAKAMRDGVGLPLVWWQTPLGAPSNSDGSATHYRDNRAHYFFAHPDQFAAAGGIGLVFGTGAANQTTAQTDGGQFKNGLASYLSAPASLN